MGAGTARGGRAGAQAIPSGSECRLTHNAGERLFKRMGISLPNSLDLVEWPFNP